MTKTHRHLRWFLIALWLLALIAAFAVDERVAQWVHNTVPVNKDVATTHRLLSMLKLPGEFIPTTLSIAVLLLIFHRRHWQAALSLILSASVIGVIYSTGKWIAGRRRPVKIIDPFGFHPFPGGLRGLFQPVDALSFPSGHTLLAFASATCLAMLFRVPKVARQRGRVALAWGTYGVILVWSARFTFFAIAGATAVERVVENAHYCSDVVAGAGLGVLTAWLVTRAILAIGEPPRAASPPLDPTS